MYHRPGYNIATQPVLQSVNEEKHFHCSPKSIFFTEHHYKWEKSVKLLTGHLELQTWSIMIHSVILFWSMGDLIFVKPSFSRETLFKNLWHQHNVNLLWEKHHIFIRLLTQEINPEAPIFFFFFFFFLVYVPGKQSLLDWIGVIFASSILFYCTSMILYHAHI